MSRGRFDRPVAAQHARVPFFDLGREHEAVASELRAAFEATLASGGFVLGDAVSEFEEQFARYCEAEHCVGVNSGTAALTLALLAAGVGDGDEVIVPAHTYIATALAVAHSGAEPVFCDVDDETGLIDCGSAAEVVSERTAAVIPVHLYGQACDMSAVMGFAQQHGIAVIEDAAQAHGARWHGRRVGGIGTAAAFSFYPSKNLGALGDGGAVCTGDGLLAERLRRLRNLGQQNKGEHVEVGFNERLDGLQAGFLSAKLRHLDRLNEERRSRAALYRRLLPSELGQLPERDPESCVWHLFPVRVADREELAERLEGNGVSTAIHYSPAVCDQPPFADAAPRTEFSNARAWAAQELSLPMFATLRDAEVEQVAQNVRELEVRHAA